MGRIFQYIIMQILLTVDESYSKYNLFGDPGQAYAIQINVGQPPQKLYVLVDTGSTTLAIASSVDSGSYNYFVTKNSSTLHEHEKEVQAKYSQGMWKGRLASDLVKFPGLPSIPGIICDLALITKSHQFFMNGSNWQGLLGLAYVPVGAWADDIAVESWIDSLDRYLLKPTAFQLSLCGVQSPTNSTHYGKLEVTGDQSVDKNDFTFRTPILRRQWYEVGVLSIRTLENENSVQWEGSTSDLVYQKQIENCIDLNEEKSIVDSGTTNIKLPAKYFKQIADKLRGAAMSANFFMSDDFWYQGEAACWSEPQQWPLPWLAIDLLSVDSDQQYFTLELPPPNFMRVVSAHDATEKGRLSEYCYKFGLEASEKETVLGYTALEGLKVFFNRSSGWIGWKTSDCGPDSRITGPHNASASIIELCRLKRSVNEVAVSIKTAQWLLCAVSIVAAGVLVYLLVPCIKMVFFRRRFRDLQISSQTALVEQEPT